MADQIIINGRSVSTSDLATDASGTNYILIRTNGRPLNWAQKEQLTSLGVHIQEFVGDRTSQIYLCSYQPTSLDEIRNQDFIDYANPYSPTFTVPNVVQEAAREAAAGAGGDNDGKLEVDLLLHQNLGEPNDALLDKVAEATGVPRSDLNVRSGAIRVKLDEAALDRVAAVDEVRVIHTVLTPKLFNNVAREVLRLDNVSSGGSKCRGKGQIVCVADTGFDKGSTTDTLDDFKGRVNSLHVWGRPDANLSDDPDGHGTHVCGSVLGSGNHKSQGVIEGAAPDASLIVQSTLSGLTADGRAQLGGIPDDLGLLFAQAYEENARVHTNSWGVPLRANGEQWPYEQFCENIDQFVWDHQDMTILFAAGNDGQDSDLDGKVNERSLGAQASAKNIITVGATENNRPDLISGRENLPYHYGSFWPSDFPQNPLKDDHMANNVEGLAAFSSRGPTAENRLKPDIVAPGTGILSTLSRNKQFTQSVDVFGESDDSTYWYLAGTSMATPLVAGCCAVVREALFNAGHVDEINGLKQPTGSLVKALLVNGATPIHGQYMPAEVGTEPNSHSGFGRVDMSTSIPSSGNRNFGYGISVISEKREAAVTVRIPVPQISGSSTTGNTSGPTLKVTMVYADLPGGSLRNDINLVVVAGKRERHGNQVSQEFEIDSPEGFDGDNNVEQVIWPQVPVDSVDLVFKPFRLEADVPYAYAWRFY